MLGTVGLEENYLCFQILKDIPRMTSLAHLFQQKPVQEVSILHVASGDGSPTPFDFFVFSYPSPSLTANAYNFVLVNYIHLLSLFQVMPKKINTK